MSTGYAVRFQEMIAKMPETLTMKEVEEYCKNAKKEIKATINEEKKVKKTAVQKKRVKKVEVDDDGNEIEKVKKPLNAYQQFIRDNRQKVKEENPDAKGDEIFTMIAALWQKHKEDKKDSDVDDEKKEDSDDDCEITRVDDDKKVKKARVKKDKKGYSD